MKFNAITKKPVHLLHDLNEKKKTISFHGIFFSEIKNIVSGGAIRSIVSVAFFARSVRYKLMRFR